MRPSVVLYAGHVLLWTGVAMADFYASLPLIMETSFVPAICLISGAAILIKYKLDESQ